MTPFLWTIIAAIGGGGVTAVIASLLIRKKTKAETINLMATASSALAAGAADMVPYYKDRIDNLEKRLEASELRSLQALHDSTVAKAHEEACRARLTVVEAKVEELLQRLAHPTGTTTVTTAVTTPLEP